MLDSKNCCLVVIDVQGKLAGLMANKEELFANIVLLIKAAKILDIPILWSQQAPEQLGPTIPQIAELLADNKPINKVTFSCFADEQFKDRLDAVNGRRILLCGIEAHVCVYQTAMDLLGNGRQVAVVCDAVSSRTPANKKIALRKMSRRGADITSTEMAIFEILKTAKHPNFKEIAKLVK